MTNFLCELIEKCKVDNNYPNMKDFIVEPLSEIHGSSR